MALVRRGRKWRVSEIRVIEAEEGAMRNVGEKIVEVVRTKPKIRVKLEDVRIIRTRVMNLCENVEEDRNSEG